MEDFQIGEQLLIGFRIRYFLFIVSQKWYNCYANSCAGLMESDPLIHEDDESSIRWLIEQFRPGQWQQMAEAIKLIRENSGYGRFIFVVRDGAIQDHPKVEISL